MDIDFKKFRFKSPTTVAIYGPTSSGKTFLVYKIIENRHHMFEQPITKIIWYYNTFQNTFEKYKNQITFVNGLKLLPEYVKKNNHHSLFIIDDLLEDINTSLSQLFTQFSHHYNISVFFLSQVLFPKNPIGRTISLNSHYLILFKNKRDSSTISRLSGQLYPKLAKEFLHIYNEATSEKYSYLLIDVHPASSYPSPVIRTGILPQNIERIYYLD